MAGKEANELSTIPSLATNDLVVVYDTSEAADEKLKNMVYSDFKSDVVSGYATVSYVDGSIITDHGALTGLTDDDHSHYYNTTRLEAWWATKVPDFDEHNELSGLDADDHTQYYNAARLESWWTTKSGGMDDHNELNNIQGGTADEYYHLTSAEYTELQSGYVTDVEMTTISGDIVAQIPSLVGYATESYVDSEIATLSGIITSNDSFIGLGDTPNSYSESQVLYYTASGVTSSSELTLVEGSGLDVAGHVAIGSDAGVDAFFPASLFIYDTLSGTTPYGIYVYVDNEVSDPGASTKAITGFVFSDTTEQDTIQAADFFASNSGEYGTIGTVMGNRGAAGMTGDHTTINNIIGVRGSTATGYSMISGTVNTMKAGEFQVLEYGSGEMYITDAYGVHIEAPGTSPTTGENQNLYGLYIDNMDAGFNNAYNLYSAGASSINKFEGNIEFGGTISGSGDIYCNDIYTASGTVYVGDLKLSSSGGDTLLINDVTLNDVIGAFENGTTPLNVGASDSVAGLVNIYGDDINEGGELRVYLPGDTDFDIDYYSFKVPAGSPYLQIGPSDDPDSLIYDNKWNFTGSNGVKIDATLTVDGTTYVGGLQLATGATVDTIETTLTNDDTHLPTAGAVYDALGSIDGLSGSTMTFYQTDYGNTWTFTASYGDWNMTNTVDDYSIALFGHDSGSNKKTMAIFHVEDGVRLYHDGTVEGQTTSGAWRANNGLQIASSTIVNDIETTLTDDDTHLPTSGAVKDYVDTEVAGVTFSGTDDHSHAAYVPWNYGSGTISGTGDIHGGDIYTSKIKSYAAIELYDSGNLVAATLGNGWEIYNGSDRAGMSVDSSAFKLTNSDGNVIKLSATASGGEVDMLTADADDELIDFGANTISGTGDIYCNDIHTSSGTVYIGDLKLSDSGSGDLLVNDSPIGSTDSLPFPLYPGNTVASGIGQPGNQSLEISVVNGLAVILNDDGAGGGVASVSAADFIRSVKCWPDNWSSLTYGIDESGDTPPPTFYSDPVDAELILDCSTASTLVVRIWVNDPSWGYKYAESYVLVQDNDVVCP